MRHCIVLLGLFGGINLAHIAAAQTSAVDKAETILAELLAPGNPGVTVEVRTAPKTWGGARAVKDFSPPLRVTAAPLVRLPAPARKGAVPRALPEATPLVSYLEQPKVPKGIELPTKPLIKLPALDVRTPLPIPILAVPTKDRASLGDPSLEVSLAVGMKQFTPAERRPLPFTAINLPDPFENSRTGELRHPPEESSTPPVIPLDRPK